MHVRQSAKYVEIVTPAKINLFLEVLSKRSDGYHELETIVVAVTAYDTLRFSPSEEEVIALECRWAAGLSARQARESHQPLAARELLYGDINASAGWHQAGSRDLPREENPRGGRSRRGVERRRGNPGCGKPCLATRLAPGTPSHPGR
jgi:hypothetical protein